MTFVDLRIEPTSVELLIDSGPPSLELLIDSGPPSVDLTLAPGFERPSTRLTWGRFCESVSAVIQGFLCIGFYAQLFIVTKF
jgi:hypothetical protein